LRNLQEESALFDKDYPDLKEKYPYKVLPYDVAKLSYIKKLEKKNESYSK
jgi:hypothetical protein